MTALLKYATTIAFSLNKYPIWRSKIWEIVNSFLTGRCFYDEINKKNNLISILLWMSFYPDFILLSFVFKRNMSKASHM